LFFRLTDEYNPGCQGIASNPDYFTQSFHSILFEVNDFIMPSK
jgi:hypothetical protein